MITPQKIEDLLKSHSSEKINNIVFATLTGSHALKLNTENSDIDISVIAIPSKKELLTYCSDKVFGFDLIEPRKYFFKSEKILFEGNKIDINVFNICYFFHLLNESNPNIVEQLFLKEAVIHINPLCYLMFSDEFRNNFITKQFLSKCYSIFYNSLKNLRIGKDQRHKNIYTALKFCFYYLSIMENKYFNIESYKYILIKAKKNEYTNEEILDLMNQLDVSIKISYQSQLKISKEIPDINLTRSTLKEIINQYYMTEIYDYD